MKVLFSPPCYYFTWFDPQSPLSGRAAVVIYVRMHISSCKSVREEVCWSVLIQLWSHGLVAAIEHNGVKFFLNPYMYLLLWVILRCVIISKNYDIIRSKAKILWKIRLIIKKWKNFIHKLFHPIVVILHCAMIE